MLVKFFSLYYFEPNVYLTISHLILFFSFSFSNITLESEINVYRRLLDNETNRLANQTVEQILPPEPAPPSFGSELGKVFNKKIKKGPIAI
ncbi:unnamed protein product, partial [Rotaria sp. Silwood1]